MMKVKVHMLAFEEPAKVREVTLPDSIDPSKLSDHDLAGLVFEYGQNDFAIGPEKNTTCSVSSGDVIEMPRGDKWLVLPVGFRKLSFVAFEGYKLLARRDRQFCYLMQ